MNHERCTFCARDLAKVHKLISGPGVTICNFCVGDATATCDVVPALVCDFCREPQPRGYRNDGGSICDVCIELCEGILREAAGSPRQSEERVKN